MKYVNKLVTISALALAAAAVPAMAKDANAAASGPIYNPATVMQFEATVAGARQVAAGNPMPGMHITVKTKTDTFDVYLGPTDFLGMLKMNIAVGDTVEVIGSRVKFANADVILPNEISVGRTSFTLRDGTGAPVWENWGVEASGSL